LWVLAGVAIAVAPMAGCSGGASDPVAGDRATVVRVIDGDTVDVAIGPATERVRLLGIDAPESVAPDVPIQCYGPEAATALAQLLPEGTEVRISRDEEARDRFGRLLLYLHRSEDGLFVNEWLVATGHAAAVSYEPNTTHEITLYRAERRATAERVGLWGSCDGPDQPLDPIPAAESPGGGGGEDG
jgi:micrococcal nuclease